MRGLDRFQDDVTGAGQGLSSAVGWDVASLGKDRWVVLRRETGGRLRVATGQGKRQKTAAPTSFDDSFAAGDCTVQASIHQLVASRPSRHEIIAKPIEQARIQHQPRPNAPRRTPGLEEKSHQRIPQTKNHTLL